MNIEQATAALRKGKLVALPTETVYGLAADACNAQAVAQIYRVKGRPARNPLIVHVSGAEMAARYAQISPLAERVMDIFWPSALTVVLPKKSDAAFAESVTAGGENVALRCPAHPLAREIITAFDGGIAAPSANRSGRISPTRAEHVREELGGHIGEGAECAIAGVLDAGACAQGVESTILRIEHDTLTMLRAGPISAEMIAQKLGHKVGLPNDIIGEGASAAKPLLSPGLLESHYAPNVPVRLHAENVQAGEALLAFGAPSEPMLRNAAAIQQLSAQKNLDEAASNLFHMLRVLDVPEHPTIAVMHIPNDGIGVAINDRLRRAAADRPQNSHDE